MKFSKKEKKIIEDIAKAIKKNDDLNEGTSSFINYATQVYVDVIKKIGDFCVCKNPIWLQNGAQAGYETVYCRKCLKNRSK